jgi:hypothetical protein
MCGFKENVLRVNKKGEEIEKVIISDLSTKLVSFTTSYFKRSVGYCSIFVYLDCRIVLLTSANVLYRFFST